MSGGLRWTVLALLALLVASPKVARGVDVGVRLSGGTAAEWVAPYEAGNLVGFTATVNVGDFQGGMSAGLVLPDSRQEGEFKTFGLEAQWHPFRGAEWVHRLYLSPYLLAGVGLTAGDEPSEDLILPVVRWVSEKPQFLGQLGVGLTFGAPTGLYVSLDLRALNHTHGAVVFGAGFRI